MITVENWRRQNNAHCGYIHLSTYKTSIKDALEKLLKYELGFGGKPVEITKESLTIETPVMAQKTDKTIFSGTSGEMRTLLEAVVVWLTASKKVNREEFFAKALQITGGSPLLLTHFAPQIQGAMTTRKVLEMSDEEDQLEEER